MNKTEIMPVFTPHHQQIEKSFLERIVFMLDHAVKTGELKIKSYSLNEESWGTTEFTKVEVDGCSIEIRLTK